MFFFSSPFYNKLFIDLIISKNQVKIINDNNGHSGGITALMNDASPNSPNKIKKNVLSPVKENILRVSQGVLVPLFPTKIGLCSRVPTLSQNVFVL